MVLKTTVRWAEVSNGTGYHPVSMLNHSLDLGGDSGFPSSFLHVPLGVTSSLRAKILFIMVMLMNDLHWSPLEQVVEGRERWEKGEGEELCMHQ